MKKYRLLICLMLALTLVVLNFASCGQSGQSANAPETPEETTPEPMTEPAPPVFANAEELYDLLVANKPVWERERMISGTLIDLDFDGTPEFLLMHQPYYRSLTIFKFDGESLRELKTIENIYADNNYHTEFRAIIPYTDEAGAKRWIIPYRTFSDNYGEPGSYFDYYLSAVDFSGKNVTETVKFSGRVYSNNEYTPDSYYGYPYLNTEFYIDGAECRASQDSLDEFQNELDRLIRECEEEEAKGNVGYLPWGCGQHYMNPSQAKWEEKKIDFLNGLLTVESAYNLFPDITDNYIDCYAKESWDHDENIEPALKKLAEAYCGEDEAYLRTSDLYYDNGYAMCKPVIYLYPTEPTDISVRVEFPNGGHFTCTYPDYGDGWNVAAYPDGTVFNKADGLEYSYLYWEGEGSANWDFSSGFVVKGGDTASFLREKLAYLGLTPREYNEFIVYWLPLMQNNNYNLITFQTAAYEESAKLYVSPRPDSVLRVFMAYAPLEDGVDIPEQELERFERTGFSVIEWGGACVE